MSIDKNDKPIILLQAEEKTIQDWYEYFDGKYSKRVIQNFIYHNHKKPKKLEGEALSKKQSTCARKYNINQDYFKTWSRNMAYVLGFWFADGCIYRGQMFDITLNKKDKYILKKIAEELQYEGNLYDSVDRQSSRINFSCVVIYNDIIKLGGTERKSLSLKFPEVPKEYLPDFIRGYFDGDGCVMLLKNNRLNTAFTCGSKEFLDDLLKILREEVGVVGGSYDSSCMSLKFGKKDSIKIGEYMYKNSPELFLERKYQKFTLNKEENIQ